jgi:uncharacterized protein YxeA
MKKIVFGLIATVVAVAAVMAAKHTNNCDDHDCCKKQEACCKTKEACCKK